MGHAVVLSSWTLRIRSVVGGVPEPVRDSFSSMIGAPVRVAAAPVEQALASSRSDDHSRCSLSRSGQFPRRFRRFSDLIVTLATRVLHSVLSMFSPGLPPGWEGVPAHNRQAVQLAGVASFGGHVRGWVLRYAMVRRGPPR